MSDIIDTSVDTSVIDEKQNYVKNAGSNDFYANIKKFIISVIVIIFSIGFYFTSSGLLLYACKVAQSNIMPTTPNEETKPTIKEIQTNIFIKETETGSVSEKIKFSFNKYNSSNALLDVFLKHKNDPDASFFTNYIISILESLINSNYSILNYLLNTLNETFPESIIIFLAPILFLIIIPFIFFYNLVYSLYLWLYNLKWFFKKNENDSGTGKAEFVDVTILSPIKYWLSIWLVMIWLFVLFFVGLPVSFIFVFFTLLYTAFTPFFYKGEMNGKTVGALAIIRDVFKYYKLSIMSIFSFFVIISAFTKLGTVPGVFSMITLALIYFGVIGIDMFKPINEENLTPLVSYEQAEKIAVTSSAKKDSKFFGLFGGQSGGSLTKELKKISKTYFNKKT